MILKVAYSNPRGCNIYGFKAGAMVSARINEKGVLVVKAPKTGIDMHIKENGGRLFIRSMSGQTLATFTK